MQACGFLKLNRVFTMKIAMKDNRGTMSKNFRPGNGEEILNSANSASKKAHTTPSWVKCGEESLQRSSAALDDAEGTRRM